MSAFRGAGIRPTRPRPLRLPGPPLRQRQPGRRPGPVDRSLRTDRRGADRTFHGRRRNRPLPDPARRFSRRQDRAAGPDDALPRPPVRQSERRRSGDSRGGARDLAQGLPQTDRGNAAPFFAPGTSLEIVRLMVDLTCSVSLDASDRMLQRNDHRRYLRRGDADQRPAPGGPRRHRRFFALELTGRPTAALIPAARLDIYEGAPHGLSFTHMYRLNEDVACLRATSDTLAPRAKPSRVI